MAKARLNSEFDQMRVLAGNRDVRLINKLIAKREIVNIVRKRGASYIHTYIHIINPRYPILQLHLPSPLPTPLRSVIKAYIVTLELIETMRVVVRAARAKVVN